MTKNRAKILLLTVITVCSCSRQTGRNVLSFFFDGVPVEDTANSAVKSDTLVWLEMEPDSLQMAMLKIPEMNYHEPYMKRECLRCHDKNAVGNLVSEEPELCYSCHTPYQEKFLYLHGPVDAGFCLTCHVPHMSKARKLLQSDGNTLCFPCHVSYEIEQPSTHVDIGESLCTECHDPHGENKRPREKIKLTR